MLKLEPWIFGLCSLSWSCSCLLCVCTRWGVNQNRLGWPRPGPVWLMHRVSCQPACVPTVSGAGGGRPQFLVFWAEGRQPLLS